MSQPYRSKKYNTEICNIIVPPESSYPERSFLRYLSPDVWEEDPQISMIYLEFVCKWKQSPVHDWVVKTHLKQFGSIPSDVPKVPEKPKKYDGSCL